MLENSQTSQQPRQIGLMSAPALPPRPTEAELEAMENELANRR
jgi:hypothetical protein